MLSRISKGTLNVALIFVVIALAAILLPQFVTGLPGEEFYSMIGMAGGGLALITLLYGILTGGKNKNNDDEDDDVTEILAAGKVEDEVFTTSSLADIENNVQGKETRSERAARKAAEKQAKKEAAEKAKFEKQAQKDAAKAAKKAGKGKAAPVSEEDEWLDNLKNEKSDATLELATEPDAFALVDEEPTQNYYAELVTENVSATAFPSYDEPVTETIAEVGVEMVEPVVEQLPEPELDLPEWATASYEDPNFVAPFSEENIVDAGDEFAEDGVLVAPFAAVEEEEMAARPIVEEEPVVEELVIEEESDYDDDEDGLNPAERFDALTVQIDELMERASREVSKMREAAKEEHEYHEQEVERLHNALGESRSEIERLSESLIARDQEKQEMLAMKARIVQAEIDVAQALAERANAENRLRQVRIAIMSQEPVNHELLAVVDRSLEEFSHSSQEVQVEHSDDNVDNTPENTYYM